MEEKILVKKGFYHSWSPVKAEITATDDGYITMRGWQEEAFDTLKDNSLRILNAPMGSGKSLFCCYLAAKEMMDNPKMKVIISVPQTIIAEGFRGGNLELPDGSRCIWSVSNQTDLLTGNGKSTTRAMTNRAVAFLESDTFALDLASRVMLLSNQTLVRLHQRLEREDRLDLLANTSVFFDEAHHIQNADLDTGTFKRNELGKVLNSLTKLNSQITLMTATFFRGDRLKIVTKKFEDKCVRYGLPYDVYLQQMKYLRSFSLDFLI